MFDIEGEEGINLHQQLIQLSKQIQPGSPIPNNDCISNEGRHEHILCKCAQEQDNPNNILTIPTMIKNKLEIEKLRQNQLPKRRLYEATKNSDHKESQISTQTDQIYTNPLAEAGNKEKSKSDEGDADSPTAKTFGFGLGWFKRNQDKPKIDDSDTKAPTKPVRPLDGGGIAASTPPAVMKRTQDKPKTSDSDETDTDTASKPFNPLAGGGIEAAAANSAMDRNQANPGLDTDTPAAKPANPFAGGGIAAAAAAAAMKRNQTKPTVDNSDDTDTISPVAMPLHPITGGGIAAAAAMKRRDDTRNIEANGDTCFSTGCVSARVVRKETFTFEEIDDFLDKIASTETENASPLPLNSNGVQQLESLSDSDVSDYLVNVACHDIERNKHDVSLYLCLHNIYTERYLHSKSDFDRENAEKAITTSIEIIDSSNAIGMVGWLGYGESHLLDRTLERPFETQSNLASFYALAGDWDSSIDVLRSLVLRCEQHLPLYHPINIAAHVDLAASMLENGETELAFKFCQRARKRLVMYLDEQEEACLMMHTMHKSNVTDLSLIETEEYHKLVGLDHLAMIKAFVSNMKYLLKRRMMSVLRGNHPMKLQFFCFLGDSFSVLASCLSSESKYLTNSQVRLQLNAESETAWMLAGKYYRQALRGWTKINGVHHPDVMSTSCSLARCLRELGRRKEAVKLLSSVVGSSIKNFKDGFTNYEGPSEIAFYPPSKSARLSSVANSAFNAKESLVVCIWSMAVYTVEDKPNEEGRMRALELLKTGIDILQNGTAESDQKPSPLLLTIKKEFSCLLDGKRVSAKDRGSKAPAAKQQMAFVTV